MKALSQEQMEMLSAFKRKIVRHPRLHAGLEELQTRTLNPAGQPLSALIGPTGVGKTTLLHQVQRGLLEIHEERMKADPSFLPYISVEARSPERGNFDWKRFYEDILDNAHELHCAHKRIPDEYIPAEIQKEKLSGSSTVKFRVATEQMLKFRGSPPLLIDEGQHFLKMTSGKKLMDQMDVLKSISNMTEVKIMLFGNYELLSLGQLSDQLARRGREIHFGRYRVDDASDVQVFQNIIATFQLALPIHDSLDLLQHWKYLYRGTLGCIGNLKEWLAAALAEAFRSGKSEIILKDLQKTISSEAALTKMAKDLRKGEDKWSEREANSQELDILLGFGSPESETATSFITKKAPGRAPKPGERAPIRDVVGQTHLLA